MKRSEMKRNIREVLVAHINTNKWTDKQFEELAKNLLDKIEALGMKPPETIFWNRRPDGGLMPSSKNGEAINEWDKE